MIMYNTEKAYKQAKEYYKRYGIDTEKAIKICDSIPISIHCWQGDDVGGFEKSSKDLTGGIQVTGNYLGKARNAEELRNDLDFAMKYIPGVKKVNLHANYQEAEDFVDRDEIKPEHFKKWADWAVDRKIGLDFNPTYFSHPKSDNGTLSAADDKIREFWINHGIACRRIGQYFYERTGKTCVINHWTSDGSKEVPHDTLAPRLRLKDSYDRIFKETADVKGVVDGLESKLFGIGLESYTTGSYEFCMGYVMNKKKNHIILTLDTGHYHPTEVVSAKLSGIFTFQKSLLLHVSRPVRWDSDHVVSFDDETKAIFEELVKLNKLKSTYVATDYFDASINRVMAWVTGLRNTRKAILAALLQPNHMLTDAENSNDLSSRLAIKEEFKSAPFGLVWDYYCEKTNSKSGIDWILDIKNYENDVLVKR
ncbi:MAG: L-rhamnose isomerase [Clostridiaceae bacterium]|nr:L-rhamnose isomerase [Clostridiaceae bacterium]